jgi:hypothetical protein
MTDLEIYPDLDRTPSTLFASPDPAAIVAQATRIANEIAPLIREQRLVKRIGQSDHVFLEGWTLAGTMLGVFPITVASGPIMHEGEVLGYQATVEARTMAGNMVGRADAQCTHDENPKWRDAPSFQLRSMAITRASSKALRMPLGFVMHLAGYDATPAEEMEAAAARGETVTGGRGVQPGWKDLAEQQRGHADVGKTIEEHGLRQWVAEWIASKGYGPRPWAKGQLTQLRRAIEQEIHWREQQPRGTKGGHGPSEALTAKMMSDPPSQPTPPGRDQGGSDPTSEVEVAGSVRAGSGLHTRDSASASDPTSGAGVTGASSRTVPDQTSEAGERGESWSIRSDRRHDPASDPTSPASVRGRQRSGTATSGVGSRDAPAGAPGDGPPAGSPTPDSSSEGAKPPPGSSTGNDRPDVSPRQAGRAAAPSDLLSPSADPIDAHEAQGTAGQGGDAKVGPAGQGEDGGSAGPADDVVGWCEAHGVDIRLARVHLAKAHRDEFGDLRDWRDLAELDADRVPRALAYLSAQFDQPAKRTVRPARQGGR